MRIASAIAGTVLLSAASSAAMAQTASPAAPEFATQASVGNTFEVQEIPVGPHASVQCQGEGICAHDD